MRFIDEHRDTYGVEPTGYVPPVKFEEAYYNRQEAPAMVVGVTQPSLLRTRGGFLQLGAGQSCGAPDAPSPATFGGVRIDGTWTYPASSTLNPRCASMLR